MEMSQLSLSCAERAQTSKPWPQLALVCSVLAAIVLPVVLLPARLAAQPQAYELDRIEVDNVEDLLDLLEDPIDFVDVVLAPGEYHFDDPELISERMAAQGYALRLSGERLNFGAEKAGTVKIIVEARHGLRFERCNHCSMNNLDFLVKPAFNPIDTLSFVSIVNSDADILTSTFQLDAPLPSDPSDAESLVIALEAGEGGRVSIKGNRFSAFNGSSVVVGADARATLRDNLIDGSLDVNTDTTRVAPGTRPRARVRGESTAVLLKDNATGQLKNNLIKRCYKGVGIRDNADGIVKDNIIEHITTWGVALWQTGDQSPVGMIQHNIIYHTGACGAMISVTGFEDDLGLFNDNLLVKTGQDERLDAAELFCYQSPLAGHAVPEGFEISGNIMYANRSGDETLPDLDVEGDVFERELSAFCAFFQRRELTRDNSDFVRLLCNLDPGAFSRGE